VAWWWEVEELLRKLFLTALVVLMDPGSPLQVTLAVLFSGWAHVLHAMYKPWRMSSKTLENRTYMVQHASLLVTSFVFLMGLLFKVEGVSSKSPTYESLSVVMLLLCITFVAWWFYEMFSQVVMKAWRRVRGRGHRGGTDKPPAAASSPMHASSALIDAAGVATTDGSRSESGAKVDAGGDACTSVSASRIQLLSRSAEGTTTVVDDSSGGDDAAPHTRVDSGASFRGLGGMTGVTVVTNPMHVRRQHTDATPQSGTAPSDGRCASGSGDGDVTALSLYFAPRSSPAAAAVDARSVSRGTRVGAVTNGSGGHHTRVVLRPTV
jgi:hypothetical protein